MQRWLQMLSLALLPLLLLAWPARVRAAAAVPDFQVVPDVVYGHKDGLALTFDLVKPDKPNGAAILWIQSSGWYSTWTDPSGWRYAGTPFLASGFTLCIVRHGSAPKYVVPDIVDDVRRCVRYIRLHAAELGIDPERLAAIGASAGGHLALMLATTGDDGDPTAKDPVLRAGSRIATAVALYPPTDLRPFMDPASPAVRGNPLLKPPLTFDVKKAPAYSPLLQVSATTAPALLIHGDQDALVPIEQSRQMLAALQAAGVPCSLVTVPGAGHGFNAVQNAKTVAPAIFDWFTRRLAPHPPAAGK